MIRILKVTSLFCFLTILVSGQNKQVEIPIVIDERANCEITELELTFVFNRFVKAADPDSFVIIVGEKANNEKRRHNSARVSQISSFFEDKGLKSDKIYTAFSESETGLASVKVFFDGKLVLIIKSRPKKLFCTRCCIEPRSKLE